MSRARNTKIKMVMLGALLLGTTFLSSAPQVNAAADARPTLTKVASFNHQVTGVTVSKDGRIFVNFPRWTEDAPVSVAEVGKDGSLKAYPDEKWNSFRNTKIGKMDPAEYFVCVQSVVADGGNLWVLDPAAPGNERILMKGPKLVKIDLASNKVAQVIAFDENAAPQGSYLNDLRFSPDGNTAYITDSGKAALVVVDVKAGTARRVLEEHPSTQAEKDVVVHADGKELRRPDGRTPMFNADGIALSADGGTLYWQALTGKTLYRIATAALADSSLDAAALEKKVEKAGMNGVADGLWMDKNDRLYITSPEDDSVKARNIDGAPQMLVQDKRLRWPDTFSQGPDGALYVTASHIQDSPWFKPGAPKEVKSELWKIALSK